MSTGGASISQGHFPNIKSLLLEVQPYAGTPAIPTSRLFG
jgi:hypothetical protein